MARKVNISGVFPHLGVKADHLPRRTETGIGALMPWAGKLWFVTYVASKKGSGGGTGLFFIDDDLSIRKHEQSVVGTYANRMIHAPTNQLVIGPHLIDTGGNVRTVGEELVDIRITATARHLSDPENMVYMLGMEGELYELDVNSLEARFIADVTRELNMVQKGEEHYSQPHFKAAFCGHDRLVVANNTRDDADYAGQINHGRLAEWDGSDWKVIDSAQYNEVMGRSSIGNAIFATGADNASAVLQVFDGESWLKYRLPRATQTQDHTVTTEWPRIREVESERWLMNVAGMFYELPAMQYADLVWGVRPVCSHLRIIGDFCSWNGLLVMAGDQTTPIGDKNAFVGQPQANLWFGKTDDLWNFGRPSGWGGPWHRTAVNAGSKSDPYLMTGFEHKCVHFAHDLDRPVTFGIEVDFLGDGEFHELTEVEVPRGGYRPYCFEEGFSAHWVRFVTSESCTASAQLAYV